jgi:hypothetical protein
VIEIDEDGSFLDKSDIVHEGGKRFEEPCRTERRRAASPAGPSFRC